jgi:hypothetical protein
VFACTHVWNNVIVNHGEEKDKLALEMGKAEVASKVSRLGPVVSMLACEIDTLSTPI